jgi:hypothetical protein
MRGDETTDQSKEKHTVIIMQMPNGTDANEYLLLIKICFA